MPGLERLQKILAAAGVASRRNAELLIRQGRVTLNGRIVTEMGVKADPAVDHIKVDGKHIRPAERKVYILLNKPKGVISAVTDPRGRETVRDLVQVKGRIFHVGRLDYHSEGIILLTNDGEFARLISAAGERFPKVYQVKVRAAPDASALMRLRAGIRLNDGTCLRCVRVDLTSRESNSWLEITLTEGRNRQIRRMFEAVGHPVIKLKRTRIGFLSDRGLPAGRWRALTADEVGMVFRVCARGGTRAQKSAGWYNAKRQQQRAVDTGGEE
jgi:23S rRNA pseudouridine2605 synthase